MPCGSWLLVTADVNPIPVITFTLMMDAIRSSETLVLSRVTRPHITEDGNFSLSGLEVESFEKVTDRPVA
jgi:hypothetical protein